MSSRDNIPYANSKDDTTAHALWVLGLMGAQIPYEHPPSSTSSSDDEEVLDDDKKIVFLTLLDRELIEKHEHFRYIKKTQYECSCGSDYGSDCICDSVYGSDCGCDSDCDSDCQDCDPKQIYIPVTCSKNCSSCHGCSPGCGKNYEFDKIRKRLYLSEETCANIRNYSLELDPLKHKYLTLRITRS
jgi:hypothetical protein